MVVEGGLDELGQGGGRRRQGDGDGWLAGLEPLQRFLLATDGTVTPALAAYLGEPIGVRVLGQEQATLIRPDDHLRLAVGRPILERRVVLYGVESGTAVLYADSRVAVDRLGSPVRADLLSGELPIGLVLRRHRMETFRESLGAGRRPAVGEAAAHLGSCDVCWRTYAIITGGFPLIVVHEEFPVAPASRVA
jgi:beta-ribofuranosylaminobenzene 5'-phosphate synthase